jgi:7,8-dihydropterin-6-yl-methyl-4-(beta-D-ribofuranosyl)aminobenzene 5'-phosphate synthase
MTLQAVDHLQIRVLVDNTTDNLSSLPKGVSHELAHHLKGGLEELRGECLCCGAHGLSLLLTVTQEEKQHSLLFDAGPEGAVFKRNVEKLKIDLKTVEELVLSHGHWDHAGGFLEALNLINRQQTALRPRFHLNPGMFRQRATKLPDGQLCPFKKVPSLEELEAAGATVINSEEPRLLLHGLFYLSGDIPRVTAFEKGFPEHLYQSDQKEWLPDPWIQDERFLVVYVRDKGLIVFSACSHAGLINVLKEAQRLFPELPLYAVMGGFHLSGASVEKIIPETIEALKAFQLKMIIPAHCTGWRAIHALAAQFGTDIIVPSAVGRLYQF